MLEVTDMVLNIRELIVPGGPVVDLVCPNSDEREDLLHLVEAEHTPFLQYYKRPSPATTPYAIKEAGRMVGGLLLQRPDPEVTEPAQDAALAALFISQHHRNRGLGSAATAAACQLLARDGFERVLAEWVWSVHMYERLGFVLWRTRLVEQ